MLKINRLKVVKYSKENLFNFIKFIDNRVYLIFYDLDCSYFRDAINGLSSYMENIKTKIIKICKEDCLVIFGCLNICKLKELILELDYMDISEFQISEYSKKPEDFNFDDKIRSADKKLYKEIYVNKDEVVIQLYNFQ